MPNIDNWEVIRDLILSIMIREVHQKSEKSLQENDVIVMEPLLQNTAHSQVSFEIDLLEDRTVSNFQERIKQAVKQRKFLPSQNRR